MGEVGEEVWVAGERLAEAVCEGRLGALALAKRLHRLQAPKGLEVQPDRRLLLFQTAGVEGAQEVLVEGELRDADGGGDCWGWGG